MTSIALCRWPRAVVASHRLHHVLVTLFTHSFISNGAHHTRWTQHNFKCTRSDFLGRRHFSLPPETSTTPAPSASAIPPSSSSTKLFTNTILRDVAASTSSPSPSLQISSTSCPPASTTTSNDSIQQATTNVDKAASADALAASEDFVHINSRDPHDVTSSTVIFQIIWSKLVERYTLENLVFPSITFTSGAPGAGKQVMTPIVMKFRDITSPPIEVSALLNSPEALAMKNAGQLVSDQTVVELLLETLLKPEYASGALIDGYPRTVCQSECITLLHDKMHELHVKYSTHPYLYQRFRRPLFHIIVLYISKEESVRRQLHRGKMARLHNEIVAATSVGTLKPVRETDLNPALAEERYRQFASQVFGSLRYIKDRFPFHFIQAEGSVQEVQQRIISELQYQSQAELDDATFNIIRQIPLASEIIMNARHELIKRLEDYRSKQLEIFEQVLYIINQEFVRILRRQALTGRAIIRSNNPLFSVHAIAVDMLLDVLAERGYVSVLDIKKEPRPVRVDLKTGAIETREFRVYEFQISFARPSIRSFKE